MWIGIFAETSLSFNLTQGTWVFSAADTCSAQCGGGTQTVAYQCRSNANFELACCDTAKLPPSTQRCNAQPCDVKQEDWKVMQSEAGACLTVCARAQCESSCELLRVCESEGGCWGVKEVPVMLCCRICVLRHSQAPSLHATL